MTIHEIAVAAEQAEEVLGEGAEIAKVEVCDGGKTVKFYTEGEESTFEYEVESEEEF